MTAPADPGRSGVSWLQDRADALQAQVAARPDDGRLHLELAIAEKLLGRIDPAFAGLARALERLPEDDVPSRQRALFLLGLTWGDVRRPDESVRCFEAVARLGPATRLGVAARGYAASYREHHRL